MKVIVRFGTARRSDAIGVDPIGAARKAVSGEVKAEWNDAECEENRGGAPDSGGALIAQELGSWIIDKLR